MRDKLQRYRDEFGATKLGFSMAWPGLAQAEFIASIRRVGRIVAGL
ncbi:MAG: hypothetical protein H7251_12310 [Acetobacteraceae bacterium]|nr:hypothetical protein [Acetobacteraceae bacterium]